MIPSEEIKQLAEKVKRKESAKNMEVRHAANVHVRRREGRPGCHFSLEPRAAASIRWRDADVVPPTPSSTDALLTASAGNPCPKQMKKRFEAAMQPGYDGERPCCWKGPTY